MKRRLITSVVLTLSLVAAFAGTALAVNVDGPSSVQAGDTITLTVTGEGAGLSGRVTVSGLKVLQADGGFSTARDVLLLRDCGSMSAEYTCEVIAREGEAVSFEVSRVTVSDGSNEAPGAPEVWSASVGAPGTGSTNATITMALGADSTLGTADSSHADARGPFTGVSRNAAVYAPADAPDQVPRTADATLDLWTLGLISGSCAAIAIVAGSKALSQK